MNTRPAAQGLRLALGFVLICSLVLGDVSPASAGQRCYVKANAAGANNGSSWANAYTSLQSALGSSTCTEVWVAKGTYKRTSGTDREISFALKNGVGLYGGFVGTETLLTQRNPIANPTILSGNIGDPGVRTDNSYHVVSAVGTNNTAILDGFTITGGYAGNGFGGGGLYNNGSSPSLRNLTFSDNLASFGGGMYSDNGSSPSLVSVTFSGNFTDLPNLGGGAGMYNMNSSPSLANVTFSGNSSGQVGGGMVNDGSNPTLINVTFNANVSTFLAGAIYNLNGSNPTIQNSILYGDPGGEITNADSSSTTVSFSIVQGGYPGIGNLNANPLMKPLGNYGGSTQTMALGLGSPAIDKGANTGCPVTDQRGIARPKDGDGNGTAICDMGATESRFLTGTFQSAGGEDGWILESTETSEVGGTLDASQETISVGDYSADKLQARGILSFKTISLPDNAVITKATLKVKGAGVVGENPFLTLGNLLVDVRKGTFSNNTALQSGDFQAAASKNAAMSVKNNPLGGWYSTAMAAANLGYINKKGLTQFRLRFTLDDNNDTLSNYIRFYSGNSVVANRPKLIIRYYIP